MNTNLETFMHADRYVFVTPMWNFSYPPVVKAYLDNVAIAVKHSNIPKMVQLAY